MDSLEEMERFLEKFSIPRLNQEEIEIMSNPLTYTETKSVTKKKKKKKLSENKSPGPDGFAGEFYQTFQFSSVQSLHRV